ncbi:hypothetical protein JCM15060_11050 [Halanaerobaculum tunisiense]
MVDLSLKTGGMIRTITIWFYISKEGMSALENLGQAGVPIPSRLRDALQQLNDSQ